MISSLEDIGKIVVKNMNGIPILIRDVAQVQLGSAVRYGATTKDGEGEAVAGMVMMLKGENSADVNRQNQLTGRCINRIVYSGIAIGKLAGWVNSSIGDTAGFIICCHHDARIWGQWQFDESWRHRFRFDSRWGGNHC